MGQGLVVAYLNEVFAFGLCDKWLELRCCESVDKACLRDNQKKNLCAGEDREFVSLPQELESGIGCARVVVG